MTDGRPSTSYCMFTAHLHQFASPETWKVTDWSISNSHHILTAL